MSALVWNNIRKMFSFSLGNDTFHSHSVGYTKPLLMVRDQIVQSVLALPSLGLAE